MTSLIRRFRWKPLSALGDLVSRELPRSPYMHPFGEIERPVQRSTFDADRICAGALMPDARPALGAELAIEHAAAVRRPRPIVGLAGRQSKAASRNDKRHAEGRGRLLAAFPAVADVERFRRGSDFIAHGAALAAAREGGLGAGCDHGDP